MVELFNVTLSVAAIEAALRTAGTPERAAQEKAYLKSDLEHIGVRVPEVRKIVKTQWQQLGNVTKDHIPALAAALWRKAIYECRSSAVEVLVLAAPTLTAEDLPVVETYLRQARTWALVDHLSQGVVGQIAPHDQKAATTRTEPASERPRTEENLYRQPTQVHITAASSAHVDAGSSGRVGFGGANDFPDDGGSVTPP